MSTGMQARPGIFLSQCEISLNSMSQNELIVEMGRACYKMLGDSVFYDTGSITQLSLSMDMMNSPCWNRIKNEYQAQSKTNFLYKLVSEDMNR